MAPGAVEVVALGTHYQYRMSILGNLYLLVLVRGRGMGTQSRT